MATVTTTKETNVIDKSKLQRVRELDFSTLFGENVQSLVRMLGVTRLIPAVAGQTLKKLTVTGRLEDGNVPEGEIIPLSLYETKWDIVGELTLKKYRKATTAEAIQAGGYDQAVNETDKKLILDIQKSIRADLIADLESGEEESVNGDGIQEVIAKIWGQLQTKFEDDAVTSVYFINPNDVADYLAKSDITTQTAFGFNYVEDFLGMGTVILTSLVEVGTVWGTASQNIVGYYINVNDPNGIGEAFELTADPETGMVGIHEEANYKRAQFETVAFSGVTFFAEQPAGVVKGTIGGGE